MAEQGHESEHAAKLRRRAEDLSRKTGELPLEDLEHLSPVDLRRTIHELRVHQIELEMQNEELRRTQAELDAIRARYFDLYELAPVGYCILSQEGLIQEANLTAVTLLGAARATLLKQPISRFILKDDQDIYYLHRKQLLKTGLPHACEVRMVKLGGQPFWARLTASVADRSEVLAAAEGLRAAPSSRLVLVDITERKQVEEEKAKLLAQLKAAQSPRRGKS